MVFVILLLALAWYAYRLGSFPIFADEAIYLHWAQRVGLGEENIFISMFDGKTPLFMWLSALASRVSPDLLFAGRLISVLSLMVVAWFIFGRLTRWLKRWAWLSLVFILASPFIFFHARLSLLDMLMAALVTAAIFAWSNKLSRWRGVLSGILLGLAFWAKPTALVFLPLPLVSWIVLSRNRKQLLAAIISSAVGALMILSLKVSVWFPDLFFRSRDFTVPLSQVLSGSTDHIWLNIKTAVTWLWLYLPWPILLLAVSGAYQGIKAKNALVVNLSLAAAMFTAPVILLGKLLASRYFLPLGLILPVLAAYALRNLQRDQVILAAAVFIGITFTFNQRLQFDPNTAYLASIDSNQYLEEWSSGYGIKEAADFFIDQSQDKKVKVLTEGYFGTLPDGLFVTLHRRFPKNLEIIGVGSTDSDNLKRELATTTADKVYYIGNHHRVGDQFRQSYTLVKSYPKKLTAPPLEVFELK
ncbi:MAG: hypothetical protein UX85_C0005G0041 [Candidatus Beckwithbacteria bacterium GW2011_GWB1_47_15]|uniref:Glycosyltransferase RgtA/B/C/D-like domain-containing protein n=1 Tax=Candidatus Beckwithbacteria bacterium GW2011_GWB1_47_15 TaxID=1618371 RepID=A0A0G1U3T9_9BACT|nr:MAG: Uncharacterized protein UY43_C0001G0771 [Candidatus Beckwithbacteria bacterium GW2011_GWC1_49_16]KKU35749.1 MAG: hypothetical protein UX50_C0002G0176 [Candidatus Beckwithbacteria bacterium GW2011_GWA1_46_30]KKU61003.1 MAG: hypothetical protein UX85_C0005G0041 [Candidatus Beckwithbacteria bacterium GW2011_GWB1_47_15]KKU72308.1 MAG: hypothetical protein UX97_C0001G0178 [Candidatus Beckwithbacteria bacterium GW2011_GWA2_47_25]OGD48882.1 MAG: hypothetical protein A2877_00950 [Candidatus Bec